MIEPEHLERTGQTAGLKGLSSDPMDERAANIAHDVFARTRGNERSQLPDHLLLAWDDLTTAQRALYTAIARAGFEEGRKR